MSRHKKPSATVMKKNKHFLKWIKSLPAGMAFLASTTDDFEYADYVDHCEGNGLAPQGEDSDDFRRWCAETAATQYEGDILELKASRKIGAVVVTGTVGRWNGRFDIEPRVCDGLGEALDATTGGDTADVDVDYCTQYVAVAGHHHDATNHFQLWPVKAGADLDALRGRIDDGKFDPYCLYDKRFLEPITDYLP